MHDAWNMDILLASTPQLSWDGAGSRTTTASNYCDKQIIPIADTTSSSRYMITETSGFGARTKCTHII